MKIQRAVKEPVEVVVIRVKRKEHDLWWESGKGRDRSGRRGPRRV